VVASDLIAHAIRELTLCGMLDGDGLDARRPIVTATRQTLAGNRLRSTDPRRRPPDVLTDVETPVSAAPNANRPIHAPLRRTP